MAEETCETCRFYKPEEPATGEGECRRLPPHPNHGYGIICGLEELRDGGLDPAGETITRTGGRFWPEVWGSEDWCGEWQPRKDAGPIREGGAA